MQTTQNDILSFDASIKGGVKKQSKSSQKGGKEDGEFLSMVLDAAAKKGENLSEKDLKEIAKAVNLSAQTAQNQQTKAPIQSTDVKEILGEEAAENLFENATFMQLLQILEMLSGGEKISKFPNFENRLAKALSSETTLNELRGAKNLNELIEIANKLNLGLENKLNTEMAVLSGGQRQSIALLMATIKEPQLLLLDEHTAALDPKTQKLIMTLSKEKVEEKNITTLMITHNLQDALTYGNRMLLLHQGKIVRDFSQEEKSKLSVTDVYKIMVELD